MQITTTFELEHQGHTTAVEVRLRRWRRLAGDAPTPSELLWEVIHPITETTVFGYSLDQGLARMLEALDRKDLMTKIKYYYTEEQCAPDIIARKLNVTEDLVNYYLDTLEDEINAEGHRTSV